VTLIIRDGLRALVWNYADKQTNKQMFITYDETPNVDLLVLPMLLLLLQ